MRNEGEVLKDAGGCRVQSRSLSKMAKTISCRVAVSLLLLFGMGACTRANPSATCADGTCRDPEYPFCDVNGVVSGTAGACVAVTCSAGEFAACEGNAALSCDTTGRNYERVQCEFGCNAGEGCIRACTANAVVSCTGETLRQCNDNGTGIGEQTCSLGCSDDGTRCRTFQPSNGLAAALADSANEPTATLGVGVLLDTDSGLVTDANGNPIVIKSTVVTQVGAPSIRVFEARSFDVQDITIYGAMAAAFVATGPIRVTGHLAARARGVASGAGAKQSGACFGENKNEYSCVCASPCTKGTGGGGNATAGGQGGGNGGVGGATESSFSPLAGGCTGGARKDESGTSILAAGGGGGGALQLVSLTSITLEGMGIVDVAGGGGTSTTGGGSGGVIVLEAPMVKLLGPSAGLAANGGSGGGCSLSGRDGPASASPALGHVCANYFSGNGGTGSTLPSNGCMIGVDSCQVQCPVAYGGGGGAVGRARISTKPGGMVVSGGPIISVAVSTATLEAL